MRLTSRKIPGECSAEVLAMTNTDWTVEQTNHRLICDALREALRAGPGAVEKVGSLRYRASTVLYLLLLEHSLEGRGRCWSCPGVLSWLRPRPCQIHVKARDWLQHRPDEVLPHLARVRSRQPALPKGNRNSAPIRPDRESPPGSDPSPRGNAPFDRRRVLRLSTRSPDAPAPDGQPATIPDMRRARPLLTIPARTPDRRILLRR